MPIPKLSPRARRTYGEVATGAKRVVERLPLGFFARLWRKVRAVPLKTYLKISVVLMLAGFIVGTGFVMWISKDLPDPNRLSDRQVPESTKIYDRTGEHLLYEVFQSQKRTVVPLDQMGPWIPKATIAIEDKQFYTHSGIRVRSIVRAVFNNLIGRRTGAGGASTLTQQLIKITIVGDERRGFAGLFRKIKEAILAIRLERKYTKDEILQMYLNEIPYGSTNYGVEAAAQSYFQKPAKDLSIAEAATLAALVQAPSRYLNNQESLKGRRDYVIKLLQDQGYITEDQRQEALAAELKIIRSNGIKAAPHFVLYVKQLLADEFGEKLVDTGGLKVITTLDYDKQVAAEKIVKEQGDKFAKEANANNAALVAIDPKTAQIIAMVGSRDYFNDEIDGQFNVAVLGKRQPGSSFKPFVYTAAFEKGYTPETIVYDVVTDFDQRGSSYTPKNYDGKEHGLLTFRTSLQNSFNIPAVKAMYLVGTNETIDFAKRFGYTTFTGDYGLSLVLGGGEVNLLEHTNAYATLANNGAYQAPSSILSVTNAKGDKLLEWKEPEQKEAIKPELAATISNVLSDDNARAMVFGRNSNLTLSGRPVAAKTGTTNNSKDAWTMGYTPSIAVGVWVGNTIPTPMKGGGNLLAGVIWNQFMREALKDTPHEPFPELPAGAALKPVLRGTDGGIKLPINTLTGKIAVSTTPEHLIVEKTYLPPHDILHYVQKDDPNGEPPAYPTDDPQYQAWESGLAAWVERQNAAGNYVALEEPPTEYDSEQSSEFAPQVSITSPADGTVVADRSMTLQVSASAPRGVQSVTYFIDGVNVGTATYPFVVQHYARALEPGEHKLKAMAQDDQGNTGVHEITFQLDAPPEAASVSWVDGSEVKMVAADFPRAVQLAPYRWNDTKDVKIFLGSAGSERLIYTFNHAEDKLVHDRLQFVWKNFPGAGYYTLRALVTGNDGRTTEAHMGVTVQN